MRIKSNKWLSWIGTFAVSLLLLTMIFAPLAQAASPHDTAVSDAYEYPIKPGMPEWKTFTTFSEKIDACQIPEDILKAMSTKGLVETVLNYPLLFLFRAYTDLQFGFDQVSSSFNGLKELYERKDAGNEVLRKYRAMDPGAVRDEWTDLERGSYGLSFNNIEMLLSQEPILTKLTPAQRQELTVEAAGKYEVMKRNPDVYGVLNSVTHSLLVEKASNRQYCSGDYQCKNR